MGGDSRTMSRYHAEYKFKGWQMKTRDSALEMGNFVCKFGKENLVDYLQSIVYPAFVDADLKRSYGQKSYFFMDVIFTEFGKDKQPALVGRMVKDTILEREQLYVDGKLKADKNEMQSSPSSIFVLLLDVHRVLFFKETKFAPTLENFATTSEHFIREKYKIFIDDQHEKSIVEGKRIPKTKLRQKHLLPILEIIPLTSAKNISSFIKQYDVLRSVTYVFADRNDEQDNEPFFEAVQKQKDNVGSSKTQVIHHNTDGLDKSSVTQEVQSATVQGTQKVKLTGTDVNGNKLNGDNNSFSLIKSIEVKSQRVSDVGKTLFDAFAEVAQEGLIKLPEVGARTLTKLDEFRKYIKNGR